MIAPIRHDMHFYVVLQLRDLVNRLNREHKKDIVAIHAKGYSPERVVIALSQGSDKKERRKH